MAAADPDHAREIARALALDLLEKMQAGRRIDPSVRKFVSALLRATRDQPPPVSPPKPPADDPADSLLTIEQVAEALGCSVQYARRLARKGIDGGGIKASRVGAAWVVRAADLDDWVERRHRKEPAA
jgi:excisionase family DNA binding protein